MTNADQEDELRADEPADLPSEEAADFPAEEEVDLDRVGVFLGLALATGVGLLLGGLTCFGWWALFPLPRGVRWPVPAIGIASAVALGSGYVLLSRRLGRAVADWFALGYVLAMLLFAGVVMGDEALDFILRRARGTSEL